MTASCTIIKNNAIPSTNPLIVTVNHLLNCEAPKM